MIMLVSYREIIKVLPVIQIELYGKKLYLLKNCSFKNIVIEMNTFQPKSIFPHE